LKICLVELNKTAIDAIRNDAEGKFG